jgi:GTP-binding protein HflX
LVFNKSDLAPAVAEDLVSRYPGAVVISAATGQGIPELLGAVAHQLRLASRVVVLSIPYSRGDLLAALHREGEVLSSREDGQSMIVQARLPSAVLGHFSPWERQEHDDI